MNIFNFKHSAKILTAGSLLLTTMCYPSIALSQSASKTTATAKASTDQRQAVAKFLAFYNAETYQTYFKNVAAWTYIKYYDIYRISEDNTVPVYTTTQFIANETIRKYIIEKVDEIYSKNVEKEVSLSMNLIDGNDRIPKPTYTKADILAQQNWINSMNDADLNFIKQHEVKLMHVLQQFYRFTISDKYKDFVTKLNAIEATDDARRLDKKTDTTDYLAQGVNLRWQPVLGSSRKPNERVELNCTNWTFDIFPCKYTVDNADYYGVDTKVLLPEVADSTYGRKYGPANPNLFKISDSQPKAIRFQSDDDLAQNLALPNFPGTLTSELIYTTGMSFVVQTGLPYHSYVYSHYLARYAALINNTVYNVSSGNGYLHSDDITNTVFATIRATPEYEAIKDTSQIARIDKAVYSSLGSNFASYVYTQLFMRYAKKIIVEDFNKRKLAALTSEALVTRTLNLVINIISGQSTSVPKPADFGFYSSTNLLNFTKYKDWATYHFPKSTEATQVNKDIRTGDLVIAAALLARAKTAKAGANMENHMKTLLEADRGWITLAGAYHVTGFMRNHKAYTEAYTTTFNKVPKNGIVITSPVMSTADKADSYMWAALNMMGRTRVP
jgi:hypothetical protein